MRNAGPRLTIGMPAYNNAATIERALTSLVSQSFGDFRIVVSDDGSTDGTADACDAFARRDSRISVARQPRNLNYGNFRYVLGRAETPFFMFAAGDDHWHPHYVAEMIGALDQNAAAVAAVSEVAFVKEGSVVRNASGTTPLIGDVNANILAFLSSADDNSRMYGVFRTDVAQRAFPPRDFFAFDWAFSVGTLREGIHIEVPETLLWRDYTAPERYIEYVRRDARTVRDRLFPLLPFTRDLLGRLRIPLSAALARTLARLNLTFHFAYVNRFHPRGARLERPLLRARLLGGGRAGVAHEQQSFPARHSKPRGKA